jgi:hypothetical protein
MMSWSTSLEYKRQAFRKHYSKNSDKVKDRIYTYRELYPDRIRDTNLRVRIKKKVEIYKLTGKKIIVSNTINMDQIINLLEEYNVPYEVPSLGIKKYGY